MIIVPQKAVIGLALCNREAAQKVQEWCFRQRIAPDEIKEWTIEPDGSLTVVWQLEGHTYYPLYVDRGPQGQWMALHLDLDFPNYGSRVLFNAKVEGRDIVLTPKREGQGSKTSCHCQYRCIHVQIDGSNLKEWQTIAVHRSRTGVLTLIRV